MEERKKVLEMLAAGKLTAEQADRLLAALSGRKAHPHPPHGPGQGRPFRWRWDGKFRELQDLADLSEWKDELKHLGSAVTATVAQAMKEARRTIEQQLGEMAPRADQLRVRKDWELGAGVRRLTVETHHGRIHLLPAPDHTLRASVRAEVRGSSLPEARQVLAGQLHLEEADGVCRILLVRDDRVLAADVDLWLPSGSALTLTAKAHTGGIQAEDVHAQEMELVTQHGNVVLYRTTAEHLRVAARNGAIHLTECLGPDSRSVHLETRMGGITVLGLPAEAGVTGSAKTGLGRVEVSGEGMEVEYDDPQQPKAARFASFRSLGAAEETVVHLHCATRNGHISIRR
ncbi:hypothetical protein GCM10010885_14750 [Alicyclobacillus cellulosilyticus]|uniref:YvlB/LiaX N-terminal domain-containing protein n=1 Tax=Alicyclobacillus cellulosilyticus TaxID=1003997 RepID=A0A917KAC9_9BACL|nr:DUF4097 family beta strand repeat-containing protein [Alicyclobacillus cellulosilyticus]GGJ06663.1 hypothetical protein GCM10010885_14750 [Alicyclobacillus cellulosilyticus]